MYIVLRDPELNMFKQDEPTVIHLHVDDAKAEAERLARKNPGIKYYLARISQSYTLIIHTEMIKESLLKAC